MLEAGFNEGKSAVFIIGGSFGLSENVKTHARQNILFSHDVSSPAFQSDAFRADIPLL